MQCFADLLCGSVVQYVAELHCAFAHCCPVCFTCAVGSRGAFNAPRVTEYYVVSMRLQQPVASTTRCAPKLCAGCVLLWLPTVSEVGMHGPQTTLENFADPVFLSRD